MTNVIIIPSCVDRNRGDQALVWEAVRLIEDIFGKVVDISIVKPSVEETEIQQTKNLGYRLLNPILMHPRRKYDVEKAVGYAASTKLLWIARGLWDYTKTSMLLSPMAVIRKIGESFCPEKAKDTLARFRTADAVFFKGGGSIHSYGGMTDWYFAYYFLFQIKLALKCRTCVYVLPNSIGPLKNPIARKMVSNTLKKCKLVFLREGISLDLMRSLDIPSFYSPDMGFYLEPSEKDFSDYLRQYGIPDKSKVAITVRPYRFMGHKNAELLYEKYVSTMASFSEYLIDKGYHVTLVMQVFDNRNKHEDDRVAMSDVRERIGKKYREHLSYIDDTSLNCRDLEKIYSYFDYLVGTRFHSVIFAFNVGVPAIAIAYGGNKGQGIMKELGNDNFVVDIDKVDKERLIEMFETLENGRVECIERLSQFISSKQKHRDLLVEMIRSNSKL